MISDIKWKYIVPGSKNTWYTNGRILVGHWINISSLFRIRLYFKKLKALSNQSEMIAEASYSYSENDENAVNYLKLITEQIH